MKDILEKSFAEKLLSGKELSSCWFCGLPTQYALNEKDGSQIWCCEGCLWKRGKIKRFKKRMGKYATQPKKVKNYSNSTHKNNGICSYMGGSQGVSE